MKTIKLNTLTDLVTDLVDNTPTTPALKTYINDCIAVMNKECAINMPFVEDKSGAKPAEVTQEDWDALIDISGVYILDDQWIRSIFAEYIAYRVQFIEEGAAEAETQIPYREFMSSMAMFKGKVSEILDEKYLTIAGTSTPKGQGKIILADPSNNPFTNNF